MLEASLREVREDEGWSMGWVSQRVHASVSLVSEWEHGRRKISDEFKRLLSRNIGSGKLLMKIKSWVTDGISAPYLDGANVDNHRLVCVEKAMEEMKEAIAVLEELKPILLRPPNKVTADEKIIISDRMMEAIEADTCLENMLARVAREYGISLAELYDRHQAELIEKGYLEKEKPLKAAR